MEQRPTFSILDSVDSTNNYAMGKVHEGMAKHGMAWFANVQLAGKGQRGKVWQSNPGENILMSIIIDPAPSKAPPSFVFNASIALKCVDFLTSLTGQAFKIKWPNDIYFNDRKAGGILIENALHGPTWRWSVVGIGVNVNQTRFDPALVNPISLKHITKEAYNPVDLARQLHQGILSNDVNAIEAPQTVMQRYNELLYKKDQCIQLRKNNSVFTTTVKGVDKFGYLHTSDVIERSFAVGDVEWVLH